MEKRIHVLQLHICVTLFLACPKQHYQLCYHSTNFPKSRSGHTAEYTCIYNLPKHHFQLRYIIPAHQNTIFGATLHIHYYWLATNTQTFTHTRINRLALVQTNTHQKGSPVDSTSITQQKHTQLHPLCNCFLQITYSYKHSSAHQQHNVWKPRSVGAQQFDKYWTVLFVLLSARFSSS